MKKALTTENKATLGMIALMAAAGLSFALGCASLAGILCLASLLPLLSLPAEEDNLDLQ